LPCALLCFSLPADVEQSRSAFATLRRLTARGGLIVGCRRGVRSPQVNVQPALLAGLQVNLAAGKLELLSRDLDGRAAKPYALDRVAAIGSGVRRAIGATHLHQRSSDRLAVRSPHHPANNPGRFR
jgi:hypothetical protein